MAKQFIITIPRSKFQELIPGFIQMNEKQMNEAIHEKLDEYISFLKEGKSMFLSEDITVVEIEDGDSVIFSEPNKVHSNKTMVDGIIFSAQFISIEHDEPTLAEDLIEEGGFSEKEYLEAQKRSGYETRKMNKIIRNVFRN